jgi:hypothetical protein
MDEQGPQFPSLFRPYTEWIKAEVERALKQRGLGTRYVPGTVVRGDTNAVARVGVRKNSGATTYQRRRLNLIEGANVTLTVTDDATDEEVDVTLASAGFVNPMNSDGDMIRGGASGVATKLDAGTLGQILVMRGGTPIPTWEDQYVNILVGFDGGGQAIAVSTQADFSVDFAGTLVGWTILARPSAGAIKIDLWACTYAAYDVATHPVDADSICNGHEPEIAASGVKAQDMAITDWSGEVVAAGTCFTANVDSCTTLTKATLILKFRRD